MTLNIPTLLTLLRIVLIPIFVILFYLPVPWANLATAGVFTLAAITDWLDGYLARLWGETSAFGAFLDPVADKLMVGTALVLLVDGNPTPYAGAVMAIPAAIIIGREITISALREWMAELGSGATVAVSMLGKVKTSAQMGSLFLLLYQEPLWGLPTIGIGMGLLYLAAVLTLWSMVLYLSAAWPVLARSQDSDSR